MHDQVTLLEHDMGHYSPMKKNSLVAAAVLSVSLAGSVQARLTTGGELMQHCMTAPDNFCAGYIGGVIDTSHALFCFPSDVNKTSPSCICVTTRRSSSCMLQAW